MVVLHKYVGWIPGIECHWTPPPHPPQSFKEAWAGTAQVENRVRSEKYGSVIRVLVWDLDELSLGSCSGVDISYDLMQVSQVQVPNSNFDA